MIQNRKKEARRNERKSKIQCFSQSYHISLNKNLKNLKTKIIIKGKKNISQKPKAIIEPTSPLIF